MKNEGTGIAAEQVAPLFTYFTNFVMIVFFFPIMIVFFFPIYSLFKGASANP